MGKIVRRTFLIGSAAIAGGVAFGYWYVTKPYPNPLKDNLEDGQAALTPYVLVDQAGVSIIVPRAEMGQGVVTTLAAFVAEELDIALDDVNVIHGPASKAYYNGALLEEGASLRATDESAGAERMRSLMHIPAKLLGMQITGGSSSTPDAYEKMRKAGAAARMALIKAASRKLNVSERDLSTENGAVITPDGARIPYADLAVDARKITPPKNPQLKPKSEWRILGKSQPRVDMVGKCTGTAEYAIDVRLPGMLFATVKMNPHLEAAMTSFDASAAEAMPGVKKVFALDGGVAVVASNTWNAWRAAETVDCEWAPAAYPATSAAQRQNLANSFTEEFEDSHLRKDGDVDEAFAEATVIEGEYYAPYLAHATMEPMNAVAWLRNGEIDIWAGNQAPVQVVKEAAAITGLAEDNIRVHTPYMGGGFGRRAEMDFAKQAITIAKEMEGIPIKLTWSREEDITHDAYRPSAMARFRASLKNGKPNAIELKLAATSVVDSQFGRLGLSLPGPDSTIVQNAWDAPYDVENYDVYGYKAPMMLPVSSWRSVGASQNAFFQESMIDELAVAADADPIAMRLDMMSHEPSRKVIEAAAEMANWGAASMPGHARGAAFFLSFGVPTAQIVEIERTPRGVRLVKVWAAVDVGEAMDPANIEAQVQSGVIYGLSAAINGEITVEDGKVQQSNFHDYDALRLYQSPPIDVKILENGEKIRGIGEPGLPPIAPALANAVYALTGERIRELPLKHAIKFA